MNLFRHRVARAASCSVIFSLAFELVPTAFMHVALADEASQSQQSAEQLANQAYQQHQAGKYAEAIALYLKAYEASKASAILFNVATIYDRKLHEKVLAAEYFRRYLRATDAEPDLVKKATERLTVLKKEAEAEEAQRNATPVAQLPQNGGPAAGPAAATAAAPEGTPPNPTLRTAGIVMGIAGLASVGGSMALGFVAKGKNDEANKLCNGAACTTQQGVNDASQAGTFATVSTIAFFAGLALLGGGVTLYFVSSGSSPPSSAQSTPHVTVSPAVGMSSGGVSLTGSF